MLSLLKPPWELPARGGLPLRRLHLERFSLRKHSLGRRIADAKQEATVADKIRKQSEDERSRPSPGKKTRREPVPKDQVVADPHPGSVSDGTHPEASEGKR